VQLSDIERWILINQYRMLELLDAANGEAHASARKVLESGYEMEYGSISQHINRDGLSVEGCREVREILSMFVALRTSHAALADRSGIAEEDIAFQGFDGSTETMYMSYTRFLVDQKGMFTNLPRGEDFNSHVPVLDAYRRMLGAWSRSTYRYNLSRDDIIRIVASRNPEPAAP
jgi:uncharacterized protein YfbU (UPF0304 family)